MSAKDVLTLLNSIAYQDIDTDKVTVLPLMCGTGKSTAISYLIRQTIINSWKNGEGLLIVTDRKDLMENYMNPQYDDNLLRFLKDYEDQVVIMTHNNFEEANELQRYKPVLIMTTQRYFRLSVSEINQYLKWAHGIRPLIIIDEFPELMTVVDLDDRKLAECESATYNAQKSIVADGEIISMPLMPNLEIAAVRRHFNNIVQNIRVGNCAEMNTLRFFWSWYTDENRNEELNEKILDREYQDVRDNREAVNRYGGGTYYDDIFTRVRAIRQMRTENALIAQRKYRNGNFDDSLLTLLDNYELIKKVKAKVLILDGTADLSPEYLPGRYSFIESEEMRRPLNHLHIALVNIPTGKTELLSSKEKQEQLLDFIELYFSEVINQNHDISKEDWALFTYKGIENDFRKRFGKNNVEHFGNIKGKNDFRKAHHILQVGLNRYPDEIYYLIYLAKHPEEKEQFENMENAYAHLIVPEDYSPDIDTYEKTITIKEPTKIDQAKVIAQSNAIEARIKELSGETRDIMNRILLAEIEQNLFRGDIRNSNSEEDFTFHLFINTNNYSDLIRKMRERYEPLGAKIFSVELPLSFAINKIVQGSRLTYAKRFIEWHDRVLECGCEYTPRMIRESIGMRPDAIKSYQQMLHNNPVLRILMKEEKDNFRGKYIKKGNWI